jgi:hypothetical protein
MTGSEAGSGTGCDGGSSTGASAGGSSTCAVAAGLIVLTSLGRSTGAAGFTGSGALPPFAGLFFAGVAGVSANSAPWGRVILRALAWRSTNWRATISSIELDALFTSMPVSFLSRAMASGLDKPNNSATL